MEAQKKIKRDQLTRNLFDTQKRYPVAIEPSNHRTIEPSNHQTIKLSAMKLVSSNYPNINAPALLLPERNTSWHLLLDDIIGIEALSNYSKVYCKQRNAPIVVAKTLKWFEERLESTLFTRVHHGYLVNKKHVLEVKGNQIQLGNGALIPISRRKKTAVEKALRA